MAENSMKSMEAKQELAKSINGFIKTTFKENSIRSITRRFLAWGIIGNAILLSWASLAFYGLGAYTGNEAYNKISERAWDVLGYWSSPVLAVVICYFGYYGASSIIKTARKKPAAS